MLDPRRRLSSPLAAGLGGVIASSLKTQACRDDAYTPLLDANNAP